MLLSLFDLLILNDYEQILMGFVEGAEHGPKNGRLNFGTDLYHDRNP